MLKQWMKILGVLALFLAVSIGFFEWAFWQGITVRRYVVETNKLSAPVRVAVIADLHNMRFGAGQSDLLARLSDEQPDIVILAGDLDDRGYDNDAARELLSAIGGEYRCYYVTGNHEYWSGRAREIVEMVRASGVTVLEGTGEIMDLSDARVRVCGVDDPDGGSGAEWDAQLAACADMARDGVFTILATHRPERAEQYRQAGFDLVVSGHAHGGQARIPLLLNGLFAPNQGWFPKYAGGLYSLGATTMIVSRGLQVYDEIPRVFNPPELVLIDIVPKAD